MNRIAGVLWLVVIVAGGWSFMVPFTMIVRGDAAATAGNILASQQTYRLAFAANLIAGACYMGVTAILINEVETVTGDFLVTEQRISHLADTVVFLRYLELEGEIRRALANCPAPRIAASAPTASTAAAPANNRIATSIAAHSSRRMSGQVGNATARLTAIGGGG